MAQAMGLLEAHSTARAVAMWKAWLMPEAMGVLKALVLPKASLTTGVLAIL